MFSNVDEYIAGLLTRDEVVVFLGEIERMKEAIYKTNEGSLEAILETGVGEKPGRLIRSELEQAGKMTDTHFQEQYFDKIAEQLKNMPTVNIELAVEPTREFVLKLKEKLSEYIQTSVAINYKVSPSLMAGVRVAYEGKYYDYSFETMWPEIWAEIKKKLNSSA